MPDYAALAKQYGAVSSQPAGGVDYEALAKAHGAVESQPAAGGFWHSAGQFLGGVADTLNPLPALYDAAVKPAVDLVKSVHDGSGAGALDAFGRLINPAGSMANAALNAQGNQTRQAVDQFKQGNYIEAAGHAGAAALPVIGPAAAQAGELIGDGQTARGLGQAAPARSMLSAGSSIPLVRWRTRHSTRKAIRHGKPSTSSNRETTSKLRATPAPRHFRLSVRQLRKLAN